VHAAYLKATNTHSEYVIFIGFPLKLWLRERDSVLRYTLCTLPVFFPSGKIIL